MGSNQDHAYNTGLSLDLLAFNTNSNHNYKIKEVKPNLSYGCLKFDHVLPSLSLGPTDRTGFSSSPGSSSQSNNNNDNANRVYSDDQEEASPRKKLRLTKEQSEVLEDSFKEHSTLNPNQKEVLARRLNLRPRQVEVWFQNRRARTKLKQTEMECELLKKCCEKLSEENKRLQKEVEELKSLKNTSPIYMQIPASTLSMCPSCERSQLVNVDQRHHADTSKDGGGGGTPAALYFTTPHPSAAC